MATQHDERVRERAYHLWREGGGEHGQEMEHWLRAEREVVSPTAAKGATKTKAVSPAAKVPPAKGAPAKAAAKTSATAGVKTAPVAKAASSKPASGKAPKTAPAKGKA